MSTQLSQFKVMRTLVKREFLEHRLLFVYMPVVATLLCVLLVNGWLVRMYIGGDEVPGLGTVFWGLGGEGLGVGWMRSGTSFTGFYRAPLEPMLLLFWSSMAFYYLFSLYRQRQDRSILFWNSLPVSDTQALGAKLLAGLLGCHMMYALCFLAQDLGMLLDNIIFAWLNGIELRPAFLASWRTAGYGFGYLLLLPWTILWSLPVYAWLLLASAIAPRAPFAWATGPLVLLVIPEVLFTGRSWILEKLFDHAFPLVFFTTLFTTAGR